MGTKIRASRGLHQALYRAATVDARLPGAIINLEALQVESRRLRSAAKVKETVASSSAGVIQRGRAAALNGLRQDFANRRPKAFGLLECQGPSLERRRDARAKQRLVGINVADAGDQRLVEQLDFNGLRGMFQRPH